MNITAMNVTVAAFHAKHGFPIDEDLHDVTQRYGDANKRRLLLISDQLRSMSALLEMLYEGDDRFIRCSLMMEELSELIGALARGAKVDVLDGIVDLMYVIIGTAVAFDLAKNLGEAWARVHESNMTKAVREPGDVRLRFKGAEWKPPDLRDLV